MGRIYIYDDEGQVATWFDPDKTEIFAEGTRWDGNNWRSKATGTPWDHEELHRTSSGRWFVRFTSQWEGRRDRAWEVSEEKAREWLLRNDEEAAVERFWGPLAEEGPPTFGRPSLGPSTDVVVRMPQDILEAIDAQAKDLGVPRAEWVRRACQAALDNRVEGVPNRMARLVARQPAHPDPETPPAPEVIRPASPTIDR